MLYDFFRDQGSIIAGLLALGAGFLAYRAARDATDKQVSAMREATDRQINADREQQRLQARCIAVGNLP